jgi:hypothetical protein
VSQSASILGTLCAVALEKYNGAGEDRKWLSVMIKGTWCDQ